MTAVKAQVKALKADKVDIVVVLAAMHMQDAKRVAEEVPGIDYVFGAYGGMYSQEDIGTTSGSSSERSLALPATKQNDIIFGRWWNIGVRIEDDLVVTKDGYELLTKGLPRTVDEIEAVMAS